MCTLHAGGKFRFQGLQDLGRIAWRWHLRRQCPVGDRRGRGCQGRQLYKMTSRGIPRADLQHLGPVQNRRGTRVRFKVDEQIFGAGAAFRSAPRVQDGPFEGLPCSAASKSRWKCDASLLKEGSNVPETAVSGFLPASGLSLPRNQGQGYRRRLPCSPASSTKRGTAPANGR